MIYRTSSFYKIRQLTKKIKVIQGGQGASKNISICQILIEKAFEKKRIITVMTDTYDNLKDGAIADFRKQFEAAGLDFDNNYNKSEKNLVCGNSVIQFRYISDNKGQAGKSKRRDILYINEANKIGWEVASTYIGRTHEDIYIDFNPDSEFWAHTKLPILKDKDGNSLSEQIIVTYLDNEMLPDGEVDYINSRKSNKSWYRVYGLGLTGFYSERLIYTYDFAEIPKDAKKIVSGMDFGKSPDRTVLIDLYLKGVDLYAKEVFALNNLEPEKIKGSERMSIVDQMRLINYSKGQLIAADSAGKTSIDDLKKHGYNIKGVKKPKGSVIEGINKVRAYNLHITKDSTNLKSDIESFFWKVDKNSKIIPEIQGHEPDTVVCIRYAIMYYKKKNKGRKIL